MSYILEVKNLTHSYNNLTSSKSAAIDDISFSVNKGDIVGIIGHTGSGKSTLVQHLNGLLQPDFGQIFLEGVDIWEDRKNIKKIRNQVGLVFQYPEYQLFEETVFKDIAFGPKNAGIKDAELRQRIYDTCDMVGIERSFLEKSPFDLSGGEKRRVAIAGVMAMRPKVIVFDEPIAGLDPMGRKSIVKMIEDYRNSTGATVLIISHNMDDMAVLTDKLLVLNHGKVVKYDTTENVFKDFEFLKGIGLNVPVIAEIFNLIRKKGFNVPNDIFTVDDALNYFCCLMQTGGLHDA